MYPYDLNYAEGYVLNDAIRLARGQPLWRDISQFPMVRSPYPPVYLAVVGPWSAGGQPSFLAARLVSLVATVVIGGMLIWRARAHGMLAIAAAGGLWFGSTFVYQWAPLARVDLLGLALSLASVVLLLGSVSSRRLIVAAVLCSLALLTKQTLVAAPVAITLFLLLRRDARVLWFAGIVIGSLAVTTLLLNTASDGQYVRHVLFGNATNRFQTDRMLDMSGEFLRLNAVAAVLAAGAVLQLWFRRSPGLLGIYVPAALATVLTIGNVSGDINYYLEPTAALALAVPLVFRYGPSPPSPPLPSLGEGGAGESPPPWWGRVREGGSLLQPILPLLVIVQFALLFHVPNGFMTRYPPGPAKGATPVAEDVQVGDHVLATVRAAGPRALVEPAGFSVLAETPVWWQPLDLIAEQRQGRWNPDRLVRAIENHEWDVVVLNYKFMPDEVFNALERSYVQTEGLPSPNGFSYFIYRPSL